jgi:hypothetical protein
MPIQFFLYTVPLKSPGIVKSENLFKRAWRTCLKSINVFGEYAKSILPYMENTLIDIKVSLSRRISTKSQKKF